MVVPPEDDHLHHVIDTMALYVLDGGCAFEQAIMERGRGNPLFNFLFELGSKEHTYYVWRLYSFAQVIPIILQSSHHKKKTKNKRKGYPIMCPNQTVPPALFDFIEISGIFVNDNNLNLVL